MSKDSEITKIVSQLHSYERIILPILNSTTNFNEIIDQSGLKDLEVMRALQWLSNKDALKLETTKTVMVHLGKNGLEYKESGLPEKRLAKTLTNEFETADKIAKEADLSTDEINASIGQLKRSNAIMITKEDGKLLMKKDKGTDIFLKQESDEEKFLAKNFPIEKSTLSKDEESALKNLSKRKDFVELKDDKEVKITLSKLGVTLTKQDLSAEVTNRLTPAMLKTGQWKNQEFRAYDVKINVPEQTGGRRHPYNESMNIIRDVFLSMGFQEMQGPWVETAFWCMDSMWIPQDHPARDEQDTFYLDKKGELPKGDIAKKVKAAHENGLNTGSTGHTKNWDPEIAKGLLMRTHSTATTFRYFHEKKLNHNCKYFYIANNFRNEAVDATHLAEFGQAEGFIMGDDLSLADLMGFIKEFYAKLGITKIRFKPTFNPYTEPSMEAHYYNEKLGKWYSLINSGIFRPESLAPYGINKTVIAWGMGSSRIAAILTGQSKLKEIIGPEVSFDWIRKHKRVKME